MTFDAELIEGDEESYYKSPIGMMYSREGQLQIIYEPSWQDYAERLATPLKEIPVAQDFILEKLEELNGSGALNDEIYSVLHELVSALEVRQAPREALAWAIYGRKSGNLKRVVDDIDEAAEMSEFYDVVPLYRDDSEAFPRGTTP